MDLFQFIVAVLTIAGPLIGAVGYWIKKSSDARLDTVKIEMEKVKADAQQAISASKSIEALTSAIVTQVEDRKESTAATKENTAELKNFTARIGDWDERQRLFFQSFTTNTAAFHAAATDAIKSLESVVEKAIGSLSSNVQSVIPQLMSQVTPLVDKLSTLVDEVKKVHMGDEVQSGKLDALIVEIQNLSRNIVDSITRLEGKVEQVIQNTTEASHEKPSDESGSSAGPDVAAVPVLAGDGAGGAFELQPAGV